MSAKATICHGNSKPFAIEDITLDALKPDPHRVRIVACDICHTGLAVRDAQLSVPLPIEFNESKNHTVIKPALRIAKQ
jgi:aryl-alcohol dehydrogenase